MAKKTPAKGDAAVAKQQQKAKQKKMIKVGYYTDRGRLKWRMEELA